MAANTAGKVIKCKAAVLPGLNETIVVEEVEVDPPKAGEVRIKLVACGVCHSDASAATGVFTPKIGPVILGHEGSGIVESVGEGVKSVQPGDHVIAMWIPYCGECPFCKADFTNMCMKFQRGLEHPGLADGTSRFTWRGKKINHFMWCSAFSQYTVTPESCVAKINPKAPLEKVCLLGCGIPTGYGASVNIAKVRAGSTCAVWGLGGVGLAAVMGCKARGAKRIIGVDINPDKFELAKKFGCTEFLNPKDHTKTVPELLKEMTGGLGVDYAIECCGTVPTMTDAFNSSSVIQGTTTLVGISKHDTRVTLDPLQFIIGRTLNGGAYGEYKGRRDIPGLVEQYLRGELMIDEFVTHTLPLDKINDAFTLMREGKSIRTVLKLH
jgi:S-(hydroxymethyl)glutathione dehydrogenase/alcohol dehydrogenase